MGYRLSKAKGRLLVLEAPSSAAKEEVLCVHH